MEKPLYFAYGSNLNTDDLKRWCREKNFPYPYHKVYQKAYLADHQYIYNYRSKSRKGGALNLRYRRGQLAHGVLFSVTDDGWKTLDAKEGAPYVYEPRKVTVLTEDGLSHPAITYFVRPEYQQKGLIEPTEKYQKIVIEGLNNFSLEGKLQLEETASGQQVTTLISSIFAYGTLMRGEKNQRFWQPYHQCKSIVLAKAKGELLHLGDFPGMKLSSDSIVIGELVEHTNITKLLTRTDALEGFQRHDKNSLYHRRLIKVKTISDYDNLAWTYIYNRPAETKIESGDWRVAQGKKKEFLQSLINKYWQNDILQTRLIEHFNENLTPEQLVNYMENEQISEMQIYQMSNKTVLEFNKKKFCEIKISDNPINILHHDDHFISVAKPGGILVHRSSETRDKTFLLQELATQLDRYLYPVHRIDRAASGVILMAFSSEDAKLLQEQLQSSETIKEYVVLVRGSTKDHWSVDRPLQNQAKIPQEAYSEFTKIAEFSRCTLVRARIYTGRRHQIRRHLAHCAHQVIGDTTHGKGKINRYFRENYQLPRLFLHARRLVIKHPQTKDTLEIEAPLENDLREFLLRLPDCDDGLIKDL